MPVALFWALALTEQATAIMGLAAVAVPVAIHLLTKMRRRPQAWGAMKFLIQVQRRHRNRMRLEQMLLLAARCLIPLMLGLALSGPVLSGCAGDALWGGGGSSPGRVVCLVIDDSLSTQTTDAAGEARFEPLRRLAGSLIGQLTPEDLVGVWRASRPSEPLSTAGFTDPDGARQVIESLQPRYSRSDLPGALSSVAASLRNRAHPAGRTFVVLVSDWANGTLSTDPGAAATPQRLASGVQVLVAQPMDGQVNTQIARLKLSRRLILPRGSDQRLVLPFEAHLRRWGREEADGLTRIEVGAFAQGESQSVNVVQREHQWLPGQTEAVIHGQVLLDAGSESSDAGTTSLAVAGSAWLVHARIESSGSAGEADRLAADDQRWSVVQVRHGLRVGLVGAAGGSVAVESGDLSPEQWLRLVLAPALPTRGSLREVSSATGALRLEEIDAAQLDLEAVRPLDAAVVSRPDLLGDGGWKALRALTDRGGLVWVVTPPDQPATWGQRLRTAFGLDWQVGIEPRLAGSERTLAVDVPVPPALELIGADWEPLLRPVRVNKQLDLALRSSDAAGSSAWLKTDDGSPLLAVGEVGRGRVLLLATAINTAWTNLPTRPLFVPLLHETIRGVLSETGCGWQPVEAVCGDPVVFNETWKNVDEVVKQAFALDERIAVKLRGEGRDTQAASPLEQPGVYLASPAGQAVVLNPDPDAGDTRAIDPRRLERWLSAAGDWRWMDPTDPSGSLAVDRGGGVSVGWPLIWATLVLVLIEMCLARWFSHAAASVSGWSRFWARWFGGRPRTVLAGRVSS